MSCCEFCNEKIKAMPFKCKFCGRYFCIKHRLPENHDCKGLIIYEKYKLKNLEVERFKDLVNLTRERILIHLLWEYFEKKGYEVYGNVQLSKDSIIDLVCIKNDFLLGIEVKRKETITPKDWEQAQKYCDTQKLDDFIIAIETKYPFTYKGAEKFLELINKYPTIAWFLVGIILHENPPYYTLITEFGNNQEAEKIFFENTKKSPRVKKPKLRRNEIWIEHQLWKILRKEKLFVAPQLKLSQMEIDLLVEIPRRRTIAIEIKDLNGTISNIQIDNYKSLPYTSIFIVPEHLKKKIKNNDKIKVLSYRSYEELTQDYFIRSLLSLLE